VQTGTAGVDGVSLSLPAIVGSGGATTVIAPEMDEEEQAGLARSVDVLRKAVGEASV
jgi:malate/lactate dehydrogenase